MSKNKSKIITPDSLSMFDDAWLDLGDTSKIVIPHNPMLNRTQEDIENPDAHILRLLRNPDNFGTTVRLLFDIDLHPIQIAILQELWIRPFPIFVASRGFGKSFLTALYCVLRCILSPGTKIVIVGSGFRQSKIVFEYIETLWRNSKILQSIFRGTEDGPRHSNDRWIMRFGESWVVAVPMGDGTKIRGLRAHIIIADEFASISPEIYETVVQGFASVSATPMENVKREARKQALKDHGLWTDELESLEPHKYNQAIISGTADYAFKHFAQCWKKHKDIIESKGDPYKLKEIFKGEDIPESFNWKDYAIIRLPYEIIPKGFMDDKTVSKAKATIHSGIYNMEYAACFIEDSDGFFKRTLIEKCVVGKNDDPVFVNDKLIVFDPLTKGNPMYKYAYGIDPASEKDNFSIVIMEMRPDHNRIVYCWTTNRSNFKERQKTGLVKEHDFYSFCVRKIRNLMKTFPPYRIGIDAQGGGIAIEEAFHDPGKLEEGENLIWQIIEDGVDKPTDDQAGLHLLEMVQFARADWTSQANHGLRKDFEDRLTLFPRFDPIALSIALEEEDSDIMEVEFNNVYDTLSGCMLEIEELKKELTTIVITTTGNGPNARDRWDTPEVKTASGKKGYLRKDRYSALLIANMIARQANRALASVEYDMIGGNLKEMKGKNSGKLYDGPEWFTSQVNTDFYGGIYR